MNKSELYYNSYKGLDYRFTHNGMWFGYDLSNHYISGPTESYPVSNTVKKIAHDSNILSIKKLITHHGTQGNKPCHVVEIGQLYKCGENTLIISNINKHTVKYCDAAFTEGQVHHLSFHHIESHILSSENPEANKNPEKKYFSFVEPFHSNGFHSLNARTLIK
jgi:hypothetical protein